MPREPGRFYGRTLGERQVGDLILVDCRHRAGARVPRHSHEHAYFCFVHAGTYDEDYGRRSRTVGPGMLVFHPPGEAHRETMHGPVLSLNVDVGAEWLRRVAEFSGPLDRPAEFRGDRIAAAGVQLLGEFDRADPDASVAIESLTWEILAASVGREDRGAGGRPRWLLAARERMDAPLEGEPPTLRGLAREAGVHPVHFAATFRRFHGCSPGEYLRRRRLQHVRKRLSDPDVPLAQIAFDTGFADQSHLTRTFKRFTGMTPGQYRAFLGFKTPRPL
jgi:AraC family transcriptional regulator